MSTHSTSWPWATSRSHRCEPRKPAPPVTRTRFVTVRMRGSFGFVYCPGIRGLADDSQSRRGFGGGRALRPADAVVVEAGGPHFRGVVDIAQIDHQRAVHQLLDPG